MKFPTPLFVTGESVDPDFDEAFIELDEQRSDPVPHRYVHGGFKGTNARFSFYFPPKEQYQGRFFHNTYPMAVTSDIGPFPIEFEVAIGDLGFTVDSGAYYVQTNNGGAFRVAGVDPAIAAYRVNAAAAKFSRQVAQEVYGAHRPFGYLFGGSGGAYQTMGAAQNTSGVWEGFVPFVPGCNHAIPSMFTARMHALRVLRQRGTLAQIADAIDVGGSGDPYAGLDEEEAAAFREVSLMGFPPRGWYAYETLDSGYFGNISGMMPVMDPGYVSDFWSLPGYLGGDPESSIHGHRFAFEADITLAGEGLPRRLDLSHVDEGDLADAHLVVLTGEAAGATLPIWHAQGKTITLIATADPVAAMALQAGDRVRVDNSWPLALQTYHRHQVPSEPGYYGWDQFRGTEGKPIYPQRPVEIGPTGTANAAGDVISGRFHGKVLSLACLMDIDSFPWQADWYRGQVEAAMGADYAENFALYFIDNAHHENPMTPLARTHVVSYGGALQQALRDLAAWVEEGKRPLETAYRIEDTQVMLPVRAEDRAGIQPVITLTANGSLRTEVDAGVSVSFRAEIEAPPGAGKIVAAEWDFEGSGDFVDPAVLNAPADQVTLEACHAYDAPGRWFAVLRATLQREGDADTAYGRVQNLERVRVVVR